MKKYKKIKKLEATEFRRLNAEHNKAAKEKTER